MYENLFDNGNDKKRPAANLQQSAKDLNIILRLIITVLRKVVQNQIMPNITKVASKSRQRKVI